MGDKQAAIEGGGDSCASKWLSSRAVQLALFLVSVGVVVAIPVGIIYGNPENDVDANSVNSTNNTVNSNDVRRILELADRNYDSQMFQSSVPKSGARKSKLRNYDSQMFQSSVPKSGARKSKLSIAIVTMLGETNVEAYNAFVDYEQLGMMTLQSLISYGEKWGYPVHFKNDFLMLKSRQAYWSKIKLIQHYLETGEYDYILYTDIDVLITKPNVPLEEFIVDNYDIIAVDECKDRILTSQTIRSGFLMFRNSPTTNRFLHAWESMYPVYKDIENPEQSALEYLVEEPAYKGKVYLHSWKTFHSYDFCKGSESAFSMHFPGKHKVERVARMAAWLDMGGKSEFLSEDAKVISRHILRKGLKSISKVSLTNMPNPYDILSSLTTLKQEGYEAFYSTELFQLDKLRTNIWRYEETSGYWGIPNVIYFTVKNPDSLHPKLTKNIQTWKEKNPGFEVIVHDDRQQSELVLSLIPAMTEEIWHALEPVQRADIYRYVVIYTFGGWYFDVDVEAIRSIDDWGHEYHSTLVLGVEADNYVDGLKHQSKRPLQFSQYAFGAAPQHPMLSSAIKKISKLAEEGELLMNPAMTTEERLVHVLRTTGPVLWSDSIMRYLVLSVSAAGQQPPSPEMLHLGGQFLHTKIFSISGFGCGQFHSNSPACDQHNDVNAVHHFHGSKLFSGKEWQVQEKKKKRIAITCWTREPCIGVIGVAGASLLQNSYGFDVTHVAIKADTKLPELVEKLVDQDIVLWWNWGLHMFDVAALRKELPQNQLWTMLNWDDPHSWSKNAGHERKMLIQSFAKQLDLVYTTGSSTISKYLEAGTWSAKYVVVPYSDLTHYYDPNDQYACDINFVATNYYDNFKGLISSRRKIVEALTLDEEINATFYGLPYVFENTKNHNDYRHAFVTRGISFEENRKVFSSCKLTLDLFAAPPESCMGEHKYFNERVPTAMASGAVLLVSDHPCIQDSELENGRTAIFLKSTEPTAVVEQVKDILKNFKDYEHIRKSAQETAQQWHISKFIRNFVSDIEALSDRRQVMKEGFKYTKNE